MRYCLYVTRVKKKYKNNFTAVVIRTMFLNKLRT